jgi:hypothetical protein
LTIDNKEATDKNEFTSGFTVMVYSLKSQVLSRANYSFQFLYPIALAAGIFSMQQPAIPFEQSPRSFLFTIFILMVMVYVTKLFGKHAMPTLRKGIGWWVDRRKVVACKVVSEDQIGEVGEPMKGMVQDGTVDDEENIKPKMRETIRTWTSRMSGSTIG